MSQNLNPEMLGVKLPKRVVDSLKEMGITVKLAGDELPQGAPDWATQNQPNPYRQTRQQIGDENFIKLMQGSQVELADAVNYRPAVVPPLAEFLRKPPFVEQRLIEKMGPRLLSEQFVRTQIVDRRDISYLRDVYSFIDDPLKEDPTELTPSSEFQFVDTTDPQQRQVTITKRGFAMRLARDTILEATTAFDYVDRKLTRLGEWYADMKNSHRFGVLTNDFNSGQSGDDAVRVQAAANVWSAGAADPIEDLMQLRLKMATEDNYYLKGDTFYCNPDNFKELWDFVQNVSQTWSRSPFEGGNIQQMNIRGLTVLEAPEDGGIQAANGIMIASDGQAPLTEYMMIDPEHTTSGDMHVRSYIEDKTHDQVWQFWQYFGTTLADPKRVGLLHTM